MPYRISVDKQVLVAYSIHISNEEKSSRSRVCKRVLDAGKEYTDER